MQQIDAHPKKMKLFQRIWYVLCTQESENDEWICRRVHDLQLDKELKRLGFDDHRDQYEFFQQSRAAVREFGPGNGYIECDLDAEKMLDPYGIRGTSGSSCTHRRWPSLLR